MLRLRALRCNPLEILLISRKNGDFGFVFCAERASYLPMGLDLVNIGFAAYVVAKAVELGAVVLIIRAFRRRRAVRAANRRRLAVAL